MPRRLLVLLASWCSALAVTTPPWAQAVKLNDPLARPASSGASGYVVTPDDSRLVLKGADAGGAGLFVVAADGSRAAFELGVRSVNGVTKEFGLSPDSETVLFGQRMPDGTERLYRVPIDGGTPRQLSGVGGFDADGGWRVDATSQRVVYRGLGAVGLYVVGLEGSGLQRLDGGGVGVVRDFALTPDGSRAVYVQASDATSSDLYSAPLDGSGPAVRLSLPRPGGQVLAFRVGFDSLGVVYLADPEAENRFELFAVRIDASLPPQKRSQRGQTPLADFQLAESGDRLLYRSGFELYSVSAIFGGTPVRLNLPIANGFSGVRKAQLSADGTRVAFLADHGDGLKVFAVPALGTTPAIPLTPASADNSDLQLVAGASLVLFRAQGGSLYSVPFDASRPPQALVEVPEGRQAPVFVGPLADGRVVVMADLEARLHFELFGAALAGGGGPTRLGPHIPSGRNLLQMKAARNGSRFFYRIDGELFSLASGGGAPVLLFGLAPSTVVSGSVREFQLSPDGSQVVYAAAEYPALSADLCSVPIDGRSGAFRISAPSAASPADITFAGERVLYRRTGPDASLHSAALHERASSVRLTGVGVPDDYRLHPTRPEVFLYYHERFPPTIERVPLDFGAGPVALDIPEPSWEGLWAISGDGKSLAYFERDTHDLQCVDLEHGDAVRELDTNALDLSPFSGPTFTPDSARVLYLAELGRVLRSVARDGSSAPVDLSPPGHDVVKAYRVTPDGTRVVFLQSDLRSTFSVWLYSAPVDGSTPALPLTSLAAGGGQFQPSFELAPDSSRVIYTGRSGSAYAVFSVPPTGGTPPILLATTTQLIQFDPLGRSLRVAGGHALFHEGPTFDLATRLWSVPIDGSAPATQLNRSAANENFSRSYEISADGSTVFFVGEQRVSGVMELCAARIDGSAAPRVLNAPLVPGGNVLDARPSADGRFVVYRADQDQDDVVELYSVRLERAGVPPSRRTP